MRRKKSIKRLTIDLNFKSIPDDVKTVILEQAEIIKHQQKELLELRKENVELQTLRKENDELKKNFN